MIYFTRHEQRIIILLGVLILLGSGVLLLERFQPGWIMHLSMGTPDFDLEKDQISPRLKSDESISADRPLQEQKPDQDTGGNISPPVRMPEERHQVDNTSDSARSEVAALPSDLPRQADGSQGPGVAKAKININTATQEELESLPRIGKVMAQRIISYRREHGKFKSIDELINVKGIGDATLQKIKDLVTVDENP